MKRADANEAAALVGRMLTLLLSFVPAKGHEGINARTAIGDTRVNAYKLLIEDALGPPIDDVDRAPYQAALKPVFADFEKQFGKAELDKIRNYK